METISGDKYKPFVLDDIVDIILKAEQYQYHDLKQRTIQKLKNILYDSKNPQEARVLLNLINDFTKDEEEFYCHDTYWKTIVTSNLIHSENSIEHKRPPNPAEVVSGNEAPRWSRDYQSFIRNVLSQPENVSDEKSNERFMDPNWLDMTISDVLTNPMILKECGKHLYFFLRKRKLLKIIDETLITHCENCRCTFSMLYRKHHCRSCGKVFCSTCCHKKIDVPKEFLSYQQSSIFSYFTKEEKVCDVCYTEIYEYHSCKTLIRFFQLISLEIPLLQRCATLTKSWRKAVLFYLSFIREVQYKLLHLPLEDYEIRFLYSNRHILYGHSSWILQLYKIEVGQELLNTKKISNCWDCMCTRECHSDLDIFDCFVILILENKYPKEIQQRALDQLIKSPKEKWLYFMSFFFSRWTKKEGPTPENSPKGSKENLMECSVDLSSWYADINKNLFHVLIELSKDNPKIFTILYWGFSVCSFSKSRRIYEHLKERLLLESPNFSKTFIGILTLLSYCEDYYQHRDKNILEKNLSKVTHSCFCPIVPTRKIKRILFKDIKIKSSITTPIYIPYECDDGSRSAILFKKEDIRKDATAMGMAKLCKQLLEENGISVPFISYEVVPTSPTSGFIEIVQQSKTLHEIFQEGTINNYLQIHNPEKKIGVILENYMKSLAFWTIFTYILGVGDRHLENIMLTSDGVLFHIDYGFILGYETKPYVPVIRIDNSMIEGIGGNVQYDKFKSLCLEMFLCLRRYSSLLFCCFLTFASCDPPIQNTKFTLELLENHVADRLLLGQTEVDASVTISKLLDNSRDAVTLKVSDYIHTYASKIPSSKGLFSWFYPKK
jgi:hypothetical protein